MIGAVLMAAATGTAHRRIGAEHGLAVGTVRHWLRRLIANAEALRCAATVMYIELDRGSPVIRRRSAKEMRWVALISTLRVVPSGRPRVLKTSWRGPASE